MKMTTKFKMEAVLWSKKKEVKPKVEEPQPSLEDYAAQHNVTHLLSPDAKDATGAEDAHANKLEPK